MYSRLHQKLGTAGFAVAIIALLAALAGSAFAAAGLTSSQKKQVRQIAHSEATKVVKKLGITTGTPGAQGSAGAQGPAGPEGPRGPEGKEGPRGLTGLTGKGVATGTENAGTNCPAGGVWVEVEGSGAKKYVCNGEGGGSGGSSQTGLWSFENESSFYMVTISFPHPVSTEPNFNLIAWNSGTPTALEGDLANCPGSPSNPEAEAGNFCMYAEELVGATFSAFNGYTTNRHLGFVVEFSIASGQDGYGFGSWAVSE